MNYGYISHECRWIDDSGNSTILSAEGVSTVLGRDGSITCTSTHLTAFTTVVITDGVNGTTVN